MKKAISFFVSALVVASLLLATSCTGNSENKMKKERERSQVENIGKEIEKNVYPLPTSVDVIKMLTELEVGYIIDIVNPVENVKKYFTSSSRAVNLGVYGADLSYATLYNMQQEVIDYMDAIRTVSNDLNMSKIYNAPLYDSIKANYDKRDDLVRILTNAFNDTYAYLSENDQQALALLVVGGAWVEGMYLTTHVSASAYNVAGISKVLLEQKKSFELFLDITKPYMQDAMVSDFVKNLEPMKKVYDGMTTSLTEQNIKDITAAIASVRSKIIL
jgi:hypothetical protein